MASMRARSRSTSASAASARPSPRVVKDADPLLELGVGGSLLVESGAQPGQFGGVGPPAPGWTASLRLVDHVRGHRLHAGGDVLEGRDKAAAHVEEGLQFRLPGLIVHPSSRPVPRRPPQGGALVPRP